jgi:hypothetical protein
MRMMDVHRFLIGLLAMLAAIGFAVSLVGCKTKEYVYVTKTDSVYVNKVDSFKQVVWMTDTIVRWDSVSVEKNDSMTLIEKWHKEKQVSRHKDTVRIVQRDTVRVKGDTQYVDKKVEVKTSVFNKWSLVGYLLGVVGVLLMLTKVKKKE